KSHAGKEDLEEKDIEEFWGSEYGRSKNNNTIQSAFTINDLFLQGRKTIKVRDGVRISTQTGVVATDEKGKGAKYDYEILEPGARFAFFCETTLREGNKEGAFKRILEYLFRVLQVEKVSLGAMTMKGFGRVKLENLKCYEFDFSRKKDVINWLARDFDGQGSRQFNVDEPITDLYNGFTIDAWFSIRNSLIVRAYSGEPQAPDASHIGYSTEKDGEIPILPGTSGKGAIRHRALRIVKTLGGEEGLIKKLMGFVDIDEGNRDTEKIKSRLLVEETVINNTVSAIQHRIKIDRFTGGVINGALFDSMPIWPAGNNREMVNLRLAVVKDCAAWEAGLLLLVLKDLWNGDLAAQSLTTANRRFTISRLFP
ncbi:MAG: RAMP superfamily CRISPR-associated protein, partial [Firmicutes bacterium]|nr:RAMP superfamily CRISPR-associated protein [Bacillota bacterium]